jgi:hypothetical protein
MILSDRHMALEANRSLVMYRTIIATVMAHWSLD